MSNVTASSSCLVFLCCFGNGLVVVIDSCLYNSTTTGGDNDSVSVDAVRGTSSGSGNNRGSLELEREVPSSLAEEEEDVKGSGYIL